MVDTASLILYLFYCIYIFSAMLGLCSVMLGHCLTMLGVQGTADSFSQIFVLFLGFCMIMGPNVIVI